MEEMSPAVAVPFRVGNSVCDNPAIATHMNITSLKLMTDTAGLLSDSVTRSSTEAGQEDCDCSHSGNEASVVAVSVAEEEEGGGDQSIDMITQDESDRVAPGNVMAGESEEDDCLSLEGDQVHDSSCSLSVASESSSLCLEDFLVYETTSEGVTVSSIDIDRTSCFGDVAKVPDVGNSKIETEITSDPLSLSVSLEEEAGHGSDPKPTDVVVQLPVEVGVKETVSRSVFEVEYVPLWGFTSLCGRRPEMEDAFATVPQFLKIPIQMLIGDRVLDGLSKCINQTVHFFGVYDGHGGCQVCLPSSDIFPCAILSTSFHVCDLFFPSNPVS